MEMDIEMEKEQVKQRANRGQRAFIDSLHQIYMLINPLNTDIPDIIHSIDVRQLSYIHFNTSIIWRRPSLRNANANGMMTVTVNVKRKECSLSSTKLTNHQSHHSSG